MNTAFKFILLAIALILWFLFDVSCSPLVRRETVALHPVKKVLMVGDSLTCGPFGDVMELYLDKTYGKDNVHVFGSCGSSPEAWMEGHRPYRSLCGTRGFKGVTPKIGALLSKYDPDLVIIQQGTNHLDLLASGGKGEIPHITRIYAEFATKLPGRKVIWVTPPDSSKFPVWVKRAVDTAILDTCAKYKLGAIQSSRFTRYVQGKTGPDGVHYNTTPAANWADGVIRRFPNAAVEARRDNPLD